MNQVLGQNGDFSSELLFEGHRTDILVDYFQLIALPPATEIVISSSFLKDKNKEACAAYQSEAVGRK